MLGTVHNQHEDSPCLKGFGYILLIAQLPGDCCDFQAVGAAHDNNPCPRFRAILISFCHLRDSYLSTWQALCIAGELIVMEQSAADVEDREPLKS